MHVLQAPGVVEDGRLEPIALDRVAGHAVVAVQERALELLVQLADPGGVGLVAVAAGDLVDLVLELLKACERRMGGGRRRKGRTLVLGLWNGVRPGLIGGL